MKTWLGIALAVALTWGVHGVRTAMRYDAEREACSTAAEASYATGGNGIILAQAVMIACMEGKGHRYNPSRDRCEVYAPAGDARCFDPPRDWLFFRF